MIEKAIGALRDRIDGASDRELAVTLLTTIAIVGPLVAFFTYLFPHPEGTDFVLPTILFCIAIVVGIVLWLRRESVGWPVIRLCTLFGAALITAVMISVPDRTAAYLAYYVWLGIFAFYFLRPAWALATAAWIAALYAIAVALDAPAGAIELWINGAATVLGVGMIVLALRTRIDGLVRSLESAAATDDITGLPNRKFGILLPDADTQEATAVANRLRAAIEEEFADSPLALLASIRVATSSGHETSSEDLLAEADAALYVAKRRGGGHVFAAGWRSTVDEPAREPAGAPAVF